jgi:SAM-dependent methyltransferase
MSSEPREFALQPLEEVASAGEGCDPPSLFSPASNFGCGGAARRANLIYEDHPTPTVWQPDVYGEAAALAARAGITRVVDFGCGSGEKLVRFFGGGKYQLFGVDFGGSLELARRRSTSVTWIDCNLGLWGDLSDVVARLETRGPQLLIASDVIEHIFDPRPLVATLRALLAGHPGSRAVVSTPDRYRTHGADSAGPPANRCHVREWTLPELARALRAAGLRSVRQGYTRANLEDRVRATIYLECVPLEGWPAEEASVSAGAGPDPHSTGEPASHWEAVQQQLFLRPTLEGIHVPAGSPFERSLRAAHSAGLLPSRLSVNGGPAPRRGSVAAVAVVLALRNEPLERVRECLAALRNQSQKPTEVLIDLADCRWDYALVAPAYLRSLEPSLPLRFLRLEGADPSQRPVPTLAPYFAHVEPSQPPLMDALELAVRALDAAGGEAFQVKFAPLGAAEPRGAPGQHSPGSRVPGLPGLRLLRTGRVSPGTPDIELPVAGCVNPAATPAATEPMWPLRRMASLLLRDWMRRWHSRHSSA